MSRNNRGIAGDRLRRPAMKRLRQRMAEGLEPCRNCRQPGAQTFDHLIPKAKGGTDAMSNLTILCQPCNLRKGDQVWPYLRSLKDEHAEAYRQSGADGLTVWRQA